MEELQLTMVALTIGRENIYKVDYYLLILFSCITIRLNSDKKILNMINYLGNNTG